jgi:hypothetical protein
MERLFERLAHLESEKDLDWLGLDLAAQAA